MKKIGEIPRVAMPSEEDFVKIIVNPGQPVILVNAFSNWPAWKWTLPQLMNTIGDTEVSYRKMVNERHFGYQTPEELKILSGTFRSYNDLMQKSNQGKGDLYFLSGDCTTIQRRQKLNEALKVLRDDFTIPEFAEKSFSSAGLWISPRGIRSWIHNDVSTANINFQIQGKKRAILLAPKEIEFLPMEAAFLPPYGCANYSKVDFWAVDHKRFPDAHKASYMDAELKEGEALYIPPYWLHGFEHLGDVNINVNLWWDDLPPFRDSLQTRWLLINAIMGKVSEWNGFKTDEDFVYYLADNPKLLKALIEIEAAIMGKSEAPEMPKISMVQRLGAKAMLLKKHLTKPD